MEKEFITYNQALALKELGFDEPCFAFYTSKKFSNDMCLEPVTQKYNTEFNSHVNSSGSLVSAPLYQQAFRWFREKYGLFGYSYPNDYQKYGYRIVLVKNPENQELVYDWGTKDAPEEAELACLNKLIEIVKSK